MTVKNKCLITLQLFKVKSKFFKLLVIIALRNNIILIYTKFINTKIQIIYCQNNLIHIGGEWRILKILYIIILKNCVLNFLVFHLLIYKIFVNL